MAVTVHKMIIEVAVVIKIKMLAKVATVEVEMTIEEEGTVLKMIEMAVVVRKKMAFWTTLMMISQETQDKH